MKRVKTILFDLDHTLWDFDTNADETLREAFNYCKLGDYIKSVESFIARYKVINAHYWKEFNKGSMSKEQLRMARIEHVFYTFGLVNKPLAQTFVNYYAEHGPKKTNLIPKAKEVVQSLSATYKLAIVTNGFEETQIQKLTNTGLIQFFPIIITSDTIGIRKPYKRIFMHALKATATKEATQALMIGDNVHTDYLAAKKAGLHALHFYPKQEKKIGTANRHKIIEGTQITCLSEIESKL